MYRFEMKPRGRMHGGASALQHVSYLLRDTEGPAAGHVAYLLRQSAKTRVREDLIASGHGNLPAWAADSPVAFWQAAEVYDRGNGRTATTWIVSVPRELQRAEQLAVIEDMMQSQFGARHPYVWALHEAQALDGKLNPHMHVAFSSHVLDGMERSTPEHFFRQWNSKDPTRGGAQKDTRMHARGGLIRQRQAWADLCNWHLERGGHAERLDHRTLQAQGIARDPVEYLSPQEMTQAKYHKRRGPGLRERQAGAEARQASWAEENAKATQAWERRKATLGWHPRLAHGEFLERVAMQSRPPRQRTRDERRRLQPVRTEAERHQRFERPLIGHRATKIFHEEGQPHYGRMKVADQVAFFSVQEAENAGYRQSLKPRMRGDERERRMRALVHHERELTHTIRETVTQAERGQRPSPHLRLRQHALLQMDERQMREAVEADNRTRPERERPGRGAESVRLRNPQEHRGRGQAVTSRIFEEDDRRRREYER